MSKALRSLLLCAAPICAGWMAPTADAADLDAASRIEAVTVYPDAAIVSRVAQVDLAAGDTVVVFRDLPLGLDPASLRVQGSGASALTIGAVDIAPAPAIAKPTDDVLGVRLAKLREERGDAQSQIDALQAKRAMILRFAQSGPEKLSPDAKPLDVGAWGAAWDAVETGLAKVGGDLRPATDKARALDEQIQALEAERRRPDSGVVKQTARVTISTAQAAQAAITLSYRIGGVGWTPTYDAALDTSGDSKTLALTRRATIAQSTGEDWSDVALTVSTARVARAVDVADLGVAHIDFRQPPDIVGPVHLAQGWGAARLAGVAHNVAEPQATAAADSSAAPAPEPSGPRTVVAVEAPADMRANEYSAEFNAAGRITLASDGARKSFVLDRLTTKPTLTLKTAPGVDPTAYIQAHFVDSEEAPLLPGSVALTRDGGFIGLSRIAFVAPGDAVDLGFGADDKIKIQRTPVNRKENDPTWYNQSKIETREFKTSVRNLHNFAVKIQVLDQIPVSDNTAITVDLSPVTTPPTDKQIGDKRGVMGWTLDLAPGESKDVRFAYRLKWPADREVSLDGAPIPTALP